MMPPRMIRAAFDALVGLTAVHGATVLIDQYKLLGFSEWESPDEMVHAHRVETLLR
ncbi:MAG: hypothetical protein M3409_01625 [Gemmatimonadota bacterium]|nr:hypothetical protein [Gemmatimonadota bacterium]